tara:strand:- start:5822 stop:6133 length:312 start_codon:yes stop_codon:yes gene_type:complete
MNFFIMSQGKLVEVTGQPLMAHIGNEHRLLASFDLDGQKWLADVATGVTLTSINPMALSRYTTRKVSGKGLAVRLLTKVLHEKGERQVLALLHSQPVINNPDQ